MYVALAKAARDKTGAVSFSEKLDPENFFVVDDPVEHERDALAKPRLEAEARLKKLDEWE
jgi:hypothetical protein